MLLIAFLKWRFEVTYESLDWSEKIKGFYGTESTAFNLSDDFHIMIMSLSGGGGYSTPYSARTKIVET